VSARRHGARPQRPTGAGARPGGGVRSPRPLVGGDPEHQPPTAATLEWLQQAGNAAVERLVIAQRQGAATAEAPAAGPEATPEPARPEFGLNDGPEERIAIIQQQLRALGHAVAGLRVTAVFGATTDASVRLFQAGARAPLPDGSPAPVLAPTGRADAVTQDELDRLAPVVTRNGRQVVESPGGNAMGAPENRRGELDPTATHPTVRQGSRGAAVEELQQRLNNWMTANPELAPPAPPSPAGTEPLPGPALLTPDGKFGPRTRRVVVAFQRRPGSTLTPDGVVGLMTWRDVDAIGGSVSVGRIEFESSERVEGNVYGGPARYEWRTHDDRMEVTVRIRFTGAPSHPMVASWLEAIHQVWNVFKFVRTDTGEELPLTFNAQKVGSGHDASVRVVATPAGKQPGRSSTDTWHTGDTRRGLAPHEFGHLIGLDDEYRRPEEAYVETTGEQPFTGALTGTSGAEPAAIAHQIGTEARAGPAATRGARVRAAVEAHGLAQGAFAQRVAEAYETEFAGTLLGAGDIADDLAARIPGTATADEIRSVNPFLYSNLGLMGTMAGMGNIGTPMPEVEEHEHPVQPRHVRQFLDLLLANRPAPWTLERR
jgi:peptidoglycan hydrolase-like protein with peptidoglycan-binding domain